MDDQQENFQEAEVPEESSGAGIPDDKNRVNNSGKPVRRKGHTRIYRKAKAWTEHVFDFLMIFLAVTLGFFAENLREVYMENLRAKQYAQSLYDDLKIDTAVIQRTYNEKEWLQLKYDSALIIIESNDIRNNNEFIYFIERYLTLNDVFSTQDVTYQQLRSSGNFRYIRNVALYKKISDYYNLYSRYLAINGEIGFMNKNEQIEIEAKLFNVTELISLDNLYPTNFCNLVLPSKRKLFPITEDREAIDILYIKIANARTHIATSQVFLVWLKANATNLLIDLKEEYNLE